MHFLVPGLFFVIFSEKKTFKMVFFPIIFPGKSSKGNMWGLWASLFKSGRVAPATSSHKHYPVYHTWHFYNLKKLEKHAMET
jgi:hypothetical protein